MRDPKACVLRSIAVGAGAIGLVALLAGSAADAACYETVGCTNSDIFPEGFLLQNAQCDILWQMQNGIFKENGYCFRTDRAIAFFGNAGCFVADAGAVKLNEFERANIATIQSVVKIKGCGN